MQKDSTEKNKPNEIVKVKDYQAAQFRLDGKLGKTDELLVQESDVGEVDDAFRPVVHVKKLDAVVVDELDDLGPVPLAVLVAGGHHHSWGQRYCETSFKVM